MNFPDPFIRELQTNVGLGTGPGTRAVTLRGKDRLISIGREVVEVLDFPRLGEYCEARDQIEVCLAEKQEPFG